jgi:hypothetical protein
MIGDELSHVIRQHVGQAMIDQRPFVYGHIANYDPAGHRVRCIIPSMTDDNGVPLLTPWMPMSSMSAGPPGQPGYGGQIIYQGGATAQNPTAGEQVVIALFDRNRGVAAALGTFYNEGSGTPASNLPQNAAPNAPGDVLWSNPKSLIRIRANGDVEIWGAAKLITNITGDADVTIGGNANVAVTGSTTVTSKGTASIFAPVIQLAAAAGDALQHFCTTAFRNWAAVHVHGNSGPPSTPPPANGLTTIVQGE